MTVSSLTNHCAHCSSPNINWQDYLDKVKVVDSQASCSTQSIKIAEMSNEVCDPVPAKVGPSAQKAKKTRRKDRRKPALKENIKKQRKEPGKAFENLPEIQLFRRFAISYVSHPGNEEQKAAVLKKNHLSDGLDILSRVGMEVDCAGSLQQPTSDPASQSTAQETNYDAQAKCTVSGPAINCIQTVSKPLWEDRLINFEEHADIETLQKISSPAEKQLILESYLDECFSGAEHNLDPGQCIHFSSFLTPIECDEILSWN